VSTRDAEELARLDAAELALMREAQARARALEREGRSDGVSVDQSLGLPALPGWWPDHRREPGSWAPGGAGDDDGERAPVSQPAVPVTIVVPVYNALDELRACFAALVRNTTVPARILFVDDASTDPGLAQTLLEWRQFAGVELLRNSENQGFSATVNRGLRASPGSDVVVLNSDTAVTPQWLQRLISTAYSDPLTATVTPVSDNAGAFSVPRIGESNPVAPFLDNDGAWSRSTARCCVRGRRPRTGSACTSSEP
jgi:cellulose synthase/poly-beta-1,6-N-acetylglucosamine synthase-like glycosyltransferase